MIKLVLCGSYEHFKQFTEHLWSKDKDISNYRYMQNPHEVLGYDPARATIVKLSSFEIHPERDAIIEVARSRGFELINRSRRRQPLIRVGNGRFQSGGMVTPDPSIPIEPIYGRSPIADVTNVQDAISAIDTAARLDEQMIRNARNQILANTYEPVEPVFRREMLGEWVQNSASFWDVVE